MCYMSIDPLIFLRLQLMIVTISKHTYHPKYFIYLDPTDHGVPPCNLVYRCTVYPNKIPNCTPWPPPNSNDLGQGGRVSVLLSSFQCYCLGSRALMGSPKIKCLRKLRSKRASRYWKTWPRSMTSTQLWPGFRPSGCGWMSGNVMGSPVSLSHWTKLFGSRLGPSSWFITGHYKLLKKFNILEQKAITWHSFIQLNQRCTFRKKNIDQSRK